MLKVKDLVEMLQKLSPDTAMYTAGTEGIHPVELGNQFPIKVFVTKFGSAIYFDDGFGVHGKISDLWVSLDEFVEI